MFDLGALDGYFSSTKLGEFQEWMEGIATS